MSKYNNPKNQRCIFQNSLPKFHVANLENSHLDNFDSKPSHMVLALDKNHLQGESILYIRKNIMRTYNGLQIDNVSDFLQAINNEIKFKDNGYAPGWARNSLL